MFACLRAEGQKLHEYLKQGMTAGGSCHERDLVLPLMQSEDDIFTGVVMLLTRYELNSKCTTRPHSLLFTCLST